MTVTITAKTASENAVSRSAVIFSSRMAGSLEWARRRSSLITQKADTRRRRERADRSEARQVLRLHGLRCEEMRLVPRQRRGSLFLTHTGRKALGLRSW